MKTKDLAAGAVGGLVGGLVMTAFMTVATRLGIIDTSLPVKVERWAENQAGVENGLTGIREEVTAQGGHLFFRQRSAPSTAAQARLCAYSLFPAALSMGLASTLLI